MHKNYTANFIVEVLCVSIVGNQGLAKIALEQSFTDFAIANEVYLTEVLAALLHTTSGPFW